jgi:hypothetical protein
MFASTDRAVLCPLNLCLLCLYALNRVGDLNKAIAGFDDGIRVSTSITICTSMHIHALDKDA